MAQYVPLLLLAFILNMFMVAGCNQKNQSPKNNNEYQNISEGKDAKVEEEEEDLIEEEIMDEKEGEAEGKVDEEKEEPKKEDMAQSGDLPDAVLPPQGPPRAIADRLGPPAPPPPPGDGSQGALRPAKTGNPDYDNERTCPGAGAIAFISDGTFASNAGDGADPHEVANDLCQSEAETAGLQGEYVAWLSTSGLDAKEKVSDTKYIRTDGALIADNLADLTDGFIENPINREADGAMGDTSNNNVWTGTTRSGESSGNDCENWTTANQPADGEEGTEGDEADATDENDWTNNGTANCDAVEGNEGSDPVEKHLYCFRVCKG